MGKKLPPSEDAKEEVAREKRKESNKKWHAANYERIKEKKKAYHRAWHAENRERQLQKMREHSRKDETRKKRQEYKTQNKALIKEQAKKYTTDHPDRMTAYRKKSYKAKCAFLDAFKQTLSNGHCNHGDCNHPAVACEVDHMDPTRKGTELAKCNTVNNVKAEVARNTDPDGTIQLQLLCCIHHRMKKFKSANSDTKVSEKRALYTKWRIQQHKCNNCKLTVNMLPLFVFDADHINRELKVAAVSVMVNGLYTLGQVRDELKKCRMLCANCHRCETAKQMGWRWADEAFWIIGGL